jgi:hypothetical protein
MSARVLAAAEEMQGSEERGGGFKEAHQLYLSLWFEEE